MEANTVELSVVDVYDIATEIGIQFERLIDTYGPDSVTTMMPKVINILEHLERLAMKEERENTLIRELRNTITHLENEKIEKAEERHRFEKELEQIEEHWRKESHDLFSMVTQLQDQNRKLLTALQEREGSYQANGSCGQETDIAVLQRIRELSEKNRDQLRTKEKELDAKCTELDNIQSQIERISLSNKDLRRKFRSSQSQIRNLIDERADLQAHLQDQQRELTQLRQKLGLAQKENEDLAKSNSDVPDLTNKVVYDLDDPERPRFTMTELKDVLHERNELKARVSDLEDELELYRPKSEARGMQRKMLTPSSQQPPPVHDPEPPSPSVSIADEIDSGACSLTPIEEEIEGPVQGPLPYEPDDAPWKKSESGIRKFFRKLFGESSTGPLGGSPKRISTSLSKVSFTSGTDTQQTASE